MMLNMGNGQYTDAVCFDHIRKMMDLFTKMGDLQMMELGSGPPSEEIYKDEQLEFYFTAAQFLRGIAKDLDIKIEIKPFQRV